MCSSSSESELEPLQEALPESVSWSAPPLFTELLELRTYDDGYEEWQELARWIKFEEDVLSEGNRWSKPHVSTPTMTGWLHLRRGLRDGLVLMDLDANNMGQICDRVATRLIVENVVTDDLAVRLKELWTKKHRHHFEGPRKIESNLSKVIKEILVTKAGASGLRVPGRAGSGPGSRRGSISVMRKGEMASKEDEEGKVNVALQKKIEANSEAAIILVGHVSNLKAPVSVFIRLLRPVVLVDLPEVDIPTRLLYFLAVPENVLKDDQHEDSTTTTMNTVNVRDVGVALAMAITDRGFASAIYNAKNKSDVLEAIDAYADNLNVLPADFDAEQNMIEPPAPPPAHRLEEDVMTEIDEDRRMREESGLVRTGRLFGGLLNDLRRKKPFYFSDFIDGLNPQCLSAFLFLYFACLAPIIAFGGLLGEATDNRIATIESLMSGLISGVLFGLFSGQPLIVLGSTGPVYVFEKILYQTCVDQQWDYLSLRLWIGIWVGAILIILVAIDASAYVCYITRFTEELFATLIAFIFIFNAFKNVMSIGKQYPFTPTTPIDCQCVDQNGHVLHNVTFDQCQKGAKLVGVGCDFKSNVFLMSLVLFSGSFAISFLLKNFRNTAFFPGRVRQFLANFAAVVAILTMTAISHFSGVDTPKLVVPSTFKPTWEGREWMVAHALIFPEHILANPWWVDAFMAPLFALLATILIFMDQQITAVIVNRKEYKLRKGGGYHLDLFVLAIIIIICSVFGLPWFVAATVLSINHLQSLTKESQCAAPGEKPHFLGIREQRVTTVLIGVFLGLSTFMTSLLALIPMPVLFGVFLFMGVNSLKGLQLVDRLMLFFIPKKYQPNAVYLKYVPLRRVHAFTAVQLTSLLTLWVIKNTSATSIAFPVMLVVICAIRKALECIFTHRELRALDDLLPERGDRHRRGNNTVDSNKESHNTENNNMENNGGRSMQPFRRKTLSFEMDEMARNAPNRQLIQSMLRQRNISNTESNTPLLKANNSSHIVFPAASNMSNHTMMPSLIVSPPGQSASASALSPSAASQTFIASSMSTSAMANTNIVSGKPKVLIFVKLDHQQAYTPLYLRSRTVAGMLKKLENKFPHDIVASNVANVYQRNKRGLLFHLDDDMLDFVQPREVFDIEVRHKEGGAIEIVLVEVE